MDFVGKTRQPTKSHESFSPFRCLVFAVCTLVVLAATLACIPADIDSLFTIDAPRPIYRFQIAKHIRDSELWRAYLEYLAKERPGEGPVVSIDVAFEREITEHTNDGDYDAGIVHAALELEELRTGTTLLTDHVEREIRDYVIAEDDATREEVQDTAFVEVEKEALRSLISSLDLAVVRAMSREGHRGTVFISVLQDTSENHPYVELADEAQAALDAIRSSKPSSSPE